MIHAPNRGQPMWSRRRLFPTIRLAGRAAQILGFPIILPKKKLLDFREINPQSGFLSQGILRKRRLTFSEINM